MKNILNSFKTNTIVINTSEQSLEISHLTALLFFLAFSGVSSLLSYVLLSIFGNGLMLLAAFISPAIVLYIYTLCEDVVNPLFKKIGSVTVKPTADINESPTNADSVTESTVELK